MNSATALFPHGVARDVTETLTLATCERLGVYQPRPMKPAPDGKLACSACHQEHHGTLHNLSEVTNAQCASCHQDSFADFVVAHPEFDNWPYRRRTRIAFDHATHMAKHFPASAPNGSPSTATGTSFDCRQCHLPSSDGRITAAASYETACASCHEQKIQQSFGEGLALLQLPMIDVSAFDPEDLVVGEWPAEASTIFDGELPSLTRALLNADPFARSAIEQFGSGFEFLDVDASSVDDLEAVHDIVWGIKFLLHDLVEKGPSELVRRLEQALDTSLDASTGQQLIGHISPEAINQLQRAWFPNLKAEVAARRANQPLPKPVLRPELAFVPKKLSTGWVRDDADFSLRYRPLGHGSDFLVSWIDSAASTNRAALSEDVQALWSQLASQTANGLCTTCHSVDADAENFGARIVHWKGHRTSPDQKGFTTFSHDPHIILPGLQDCTSCHMLNKESHAADNYKQPDPFIFQSNFQPLSKSDCATCHHRSLQSAGDKCTQCHNYHVDTF